MLELDIENYHDISEYENKNMEYEKCDEKTNFEAKESEVISSYIVGTIIEAALNQLGTISWNSKSFLDNFTSHFPWGIRISGRIFYYVIWIDQMVPGDVW